MRERNNRGAMIVLTIIGIATLLVAVIGATFAYFTVTLEDKTKPENRPIQVETSTMMITFEQGNAIEYTGAIPGRPSLAIENGDPVYGSLADGKTNKLTFTLTSAPTMVLNAKYNPNVDGEIPRDSIMEGYSGTGLFSLETQGFCFVCRNLQ